MGDLPSSMAPSPANSTSTTPSNLNLTMFLHTLAVVGTAAVVFTAYNFIVIRCCANRRGQYRGFRPEPARLRLESANAKAWVPSFRYEKKAEGDGRDQGFDGDGDCAVCLSPFEDGDEVRRLPRCSHCFHAPCVDMWLHSHADCPLCRTAVEPPSLAPRQQNAVVQERNSSGVVDSAGATHSFLSVNFVGQYGIETRDMNEEDVDRLSSENSGKAVTDGSCGIDMSGFDVILEMDWLFSSYAHRTLERAINHAGEKRGFFLLDLQVYSSAEERFSSSLAARSLPRRERAPVAERDPSPAHGREGDGRRAVGAGDLQRRFTHW
ncbi:RING-H2 finger protein ATL52-like [Malania oleifera]|uniref:RING-H2 finger protein ATL52-like n=1 Tax=Malania oleifera TaxID=397392 RepID=UPI0025AEA0E5|nr:RING-H2 finger protein ATL52-like [Malania oleifera]